MTTTPDPTAHHCPRCHAAPTEPCAITARRGRQFHAPRIDAALRQHHRQLAASTPTDTDEH